MFLKSNYHPNDISPKIMFKKKLFCRYWTHVYNFTLDIRMHFLEFHISIQLSELTIRFPCVVFNIFLFLILMILIMNFLSNQFENDFGLKKVNIYTLYCLIMNNMF